MKIEGIVYFIGILLGIIITLCSYEIGMKIIGLTFMIMGTLGYMMKFYFYLENRKYERRLKRN